MGGGGRGEDGFLGGKSPGLGVLAPQLPGLAPDLLCDFGQVTASLGFSFLACGMKEKKNGNIQSFQVREGNGTQLQYSCLENPMYREAWQAAVHGVIELGVTEQPSTQEPKQGRYFSVGE